MSQLHNHDFGYCLKCQSNFPLRTSKALTSPGGMSLGLATFRGSAIDEPTTTMFPIIVGGEIKAYNDLSIFFRRPLLNQFCLLFQNSYREYLF